MASSPPQSSSPYHREDNLTPNLQAMAQVASKTTTSELPSFIKGVPVQYCADANQANSVPSIPEISLSRVEEEATETRCDSQTHAVQDMFNTEPNGVNSSMSRRRMASNKPALQRNISFPKRPPYLQRLSSNTNSASVSPLSTASVALNYYFPKGHATPSTPADQIIHTPNAPSTPDRTVTKPQRPTAFTVRQDSVPSPTALLCAKPRAAVAGSSSIDAPAAVHSSGVSATAASSAVRGSLPRRLSHAFRASGPLEAAYCHSAASYGRITVPLDSPAII